MPTGNPAPSLKGWYRLRRCEHSFPDKVVDAGDKIDLKRDHYPALNSPQGWKSFQAAICFYFGVSPWIHNVTIHHDEVDCGRMISAAEMVDDNFDFEKTYLVHFVENKDYMAELAWLAVMPEASSDDSAA